MRRNCKYPDKIIDFTFNLLFNMRSQINKQHMSVYVGHGRKSQGQSPLCWASLVFLICWKYYFSDSNTFCTIEIFSLFLALPGTSFVLMSDSFYLGKLSIFKKHLDSLKNPQSRNETYRGLLVLFCFRRNEVAILGERKCSGLSSIPDV